MKYKIILFTTLLLFLLLPKEIYASGYVNVSRQQFPYDVNNYYIENGYIVINGWAVTNNEQQLTSNATHQYSLTLTNYKNGQSKEYIATLKSANKTNLMRMQTTNRVCGYYEFDASSLSCYYNFAMAGFEFRIPLSDLEADTEYMINLRIWLKLVNRKYQTRIYTPAIDKHYEVDGIRYWLRSDMSQTYATVYGEPVFVRSGPGTTFPIHRSWLTCATNTLFWWQYHTYRNIQGLSQTNPGAIDSETWVNMKFDQGICVGNRSRAFNGNTYNGWIAAIYTDFTGIPATIQTAKIRNSQIDGITSYTTRKNTQATIKVGLNNQQNQTNNIKVYHNGQLVYNQNIRYIGKRTQTINFNLNGSGNLRVVVTEPNGLFRELNAPIYVSSEREYVIGGNSTINDSTPIMVNVSSTGSITNYYERYTITVPNPHFKIVAGRGFDSWIQLNYISDTPEIMLNSGVVVSGFFPTSEPTLGLNKTNDFCSVNYDLTTSNLNSRRFSIPEVYLNKLTGEVFWGTNNDNRYINGFRRWYPPINDDLGEYSYYLTLDNIGINNVKIRVNLRYTLEKTMFGNNDSEYKIIRVNIPDNLLRRHRLSFKISDLIERLK